MKRSARPIAAVAILAALFTGLVPAGAAFAADPEEPTTGGDVDDGTFVRDDQAVLKTKIVEQWNDLLDGTSVGDRDQLKADVEVYATRYGMDSLTGRDPEGSEPVITASQFVATADPAADPPAASMPMAQFAQINGYYCGPAVAYMIMKYKGITTSRYAADRGRALSQSALARSTYLRTDEQGATRFSLNVMAPGMNKWRQNSSTGFYVQESKSSMPTLSQMMKYSTYHKMPNAIGAVEAANGARYNGHGSRTKVIGHWLAGYGYDTSGARSFFADPATSVWSGVSAKFIYSSTGFANSFIKPLGNGVVY